MRGVLREPAGPDPVTKRQFAMAMQHVRFARLYSRVCADPDVRAYWAAIRCRLLCKLIAAHRLTRRVAGG